jgi:hypothetical protein
MPPANDLSEYWGNKGHHENVIINLEIEFFHKLCSLHKTKKVLSQIRIALLATEEFNIISPSLEIPPCYTRVPFSMQEIINKRIVSDSSQCSQCKWGTELIRRRDILYHVNQINNIWSHAENDNNIAEKITYDDMTGINNLFPISEMDKKELKKLKIIMLEDNKDDSKKIKKMLQAMKVKNINIENNPQKFIKNIINVEQKDIEEKYKDTVILLDLVMSNEEMQGEEVCRKINHFLPFVPILIISGKKDVLNIANKLVGLNYYAFFPKEYLINIDDDSIINTDIRELYSRIFILKILSSIESAKKKKEDRKYIESIKRANNRLGIIVAGYGDFSTKTFGNLLNLIKEMNDNNSRKMKFELLAIIEPSYEVKQAAIDRLKKENLNIPVLRNIDEARTEFYRYPGEIVIRDSSSSNEHANNHKLCKKEEGGGKKMCWDKDFFRFVEKPIALNLNELKKYSSSSRFSSVLEEVENPAVLTVKEYIEENNLSISSLEFWRYSSMDWTQLLEGSRLGVRGGSYMDKSIHDWAVAYFLLDNPQYNKDTRITADIEMFMPFSCNNLLKDYAKFEFKNDNGLSTQTLAEAEDLKMNSEIDLVYEGKPVNVKMHSSWGGVTKEDEKKILNKNGIRLNGALYKKERFGSVDFSVRRKVDFKFIEQELRLGKVICKREGEENHIIYFNMLIRGDANIYPFVKVIRGGTLFNVPLCQREGDHLYRTLKDSFLYFAGIKQTSKTGSEMSIFCHEMALKCRKKAKENIKENATEAI